MYGPVVAGALCICALCVTLFMMSEPDGPADIIEFERSDPLLIHTALGALQGIVQGGKRFYGNIPFAQPPIGDLRWQPPRPASPWSGIRLSNKKSPSCFKTEDCLYLNVWTPDEDVGGLPVMVWIHGGCYKNGTSNVGHRHNLVEHGVVLVTVNYRLGAIGFLGGQLMQQHTSDGSSGTFGLQDQRLALEWVKQHISSFGGDSNNVLIFGESAGAGSVSAHLVMPSSWPFFHRAILQSGSFPPWGSQDIDSSERTAAAVLDHFGCAGLACLEQVDFELLQTLPYTDPSGPSGCRYCVRWSPTVDHVHLHGYVHEMLTASAGKVAMVPLLMGVNRDEGSLFTYASNSTADLNAEVVKKCHLNPKNYCAKTFDNNEYQLRSKESFTEYLQANYQHPIAERLLNMYPAPRQHSVSWLPSYWWAAMQVYSDRDFICPAQRTALSLGPRRPLYLYRFVHEPHVFRTDITCPVVYHGAEIPFAFGKKCQSNPEKKGYNESSCVATTDEPGWQLASQMSRYWTNFAKFSDPNANDTSLPHWPQFTPEKPINIVLNSKQITFDTFIATRQECSLWNGILDSPQGIPPKTWNASC